MQFLFTFYAFTPFLTKLFRLVYAYIYKFMHLKQNFPKILFYILFIMKFLLEHSFKFQFLPEGLKVTSFVRISLK